MNTAQKDYLKYGLKYSSNILLNTAEIKQISIFINFCHIVRGISLIFSILLFFILKKKAIQNG